MHPPRIRVRGRLLPQDAPTPQARRRVSSTMPRCRRRARARSWRSARRRARRRSRRDYRRPDRHGGCRAPPTPAARRWPARGRPAHRTSAAHAGARGRAAGVRRHARAGREQGRAVDQALVPVLRLADRRMMDEHHAEGAFATEVRKRLRETRQLLGTEPAGRAERRGRDRARKPDQGDGSAPSHEREWHGLAAPSPASGRAGEGAFHPHSYTPPSAAAGAAPSSARRCRGCRARRSPARAGQGARATRARARIRRRARD